MRKKKLIAVVLTAAMLVTMSPIAAFAQQDPDLLKDRTENGVLSSDFMSDWEEIDRADVKASENLRTENNTVTPGDGTEKPGTVTPGDGTEKPGTVTPGDGTEKPGTITPGDGTVTPGDGTVTPGDGSEKIDLSDAVVTAEEQTYRGEAIEPAVTVTLNEKVLIEGTDFTVASYFDNTNAGTAGITVAGTGEYTGTASGSFKINPLSITPVVSVNNTSLTYNGSDQKPEFSVSYGELIFTQEEFTAAFIPEISKNVGTYRVEVTLKGNYSGTASARFSIAAKNVTPVISFNKNSFVYNRKTQRPVVTVTCEGDQITKNDYDIELPEKSVYVGTYEVKVTMKGNYAGTASAQYKITKAAQNGTVNFSKITLAAGRTATLKMTGAKGKVTYSSGNADIAKVGKTGGVITANKVGIVTITATAAATTNYAKQTEKILVTVVPPATTSITTTKTSKGIKLTWKKVPGAQGYLLYNGSGKLLKKITKASTLTYTDTTANKNAKQYSYKIVAYGSTGKSTRYRTISTYFLSPPSAPSLSSQTAKTMTVKWNKNSKATGYVVEYSRNSKFESDVKKSAVSNPSTLTKTIGMLTKGKRYYVRVCSYKIVSGKTYYSAYSPVKSIKVK